MRGRVMRPFNVSLRNAGYRVSRSDKVRSFLKWTEVGGAGVSDQPLSSDDLKRILSKHANGGDKNASIRACEVLNRINLAERDAAKSEHPLDLTAILEQIARHSPELAAGLAKEKGIDWDAARP